MSLTSGNSIYDIFKDVVYFLKPIFAITFGFLLFSSLEPRNIYRTIIILGVIFAVFHLFSVLSVSNLFSQSIHTIRAQAGLNNFIEMLSILIFLVLRKNNIQIFSRVRTRFFFVILFVSFAMYFSRTMLLSLGVMYLFAMGYHRLSKKGIYIVVSIFVFVILFYWYLFSIELSIGATGVEGFLYKIRMAPSEIFYNGNIDVKNIAFKDLRYLYDHWRGFEASRAIEQLNGINFFFGNGFGALVDLGFEMDFHGDKLQYIPVLHNGYVYVLFKTGIFGLILYLFFFYGLYKNLNRRDYIDRDHKICSSLALALASFYFLTSFVITGIYNQGDLTTLIFGAILSICGRKVYQLKAEFK
ncbi:hypothetical protein [Seonamhaeicola sp. ML3]|uniref:hypothetical protein n=1 Tax=Seonamhaeicola sp. ML3 TaxID=2937786 RepID=UPI002010683A|nr:hypothetical protein [Seonamhaeicola sp. ML3]